MMSENAYFIKDAIGPKGSISIEKDTSGQPQGKSADVEDHGVVNKLRLHHADTDEHDNLIKPDEIIEIEDEPDHDQLCQIEQEYFLKVIQEDVDMTEHLNVAIQTLQIVLACDESVRTKKIVPLDPISF